MEDNEKAGLEAGPEAPAAEAGGERKEPEIDKLFTLRFRIPQEDYYQFHALMGAANIKKGRRKTQILGALEFLFGVGFLISLITTNTQGGIFYYFMIAVLIGMGFYGMTYYKLFYEKSLRRAVAKQYAKVPYLQNDIVIDFYPNKLVEHVQSNNVETFWHTIKELRVSDSLYMIMLEERRALLIPKSQLGTQAEEFETLMREVCANFEKARYDV